MANRILRTWNDRLRSTCLEAWKSYTETCRRAKNEERIHGEMAALKDECAAGRVSNTQRGRHMALTPLLLTPLLPSSLSAGTRRRWRK
jgi:hypothetical protein